MVEISFEMRESGVRKTLRLTMAVAAAAAISSLSVGNAHAQDGGRLSRILSPAVCGLQINLLGNNNQQTVTCNENSTPTPPPSGGGLTGFDTEFGNATVQPGEVAIATATCPNGKAPTGGGFSENPGDSWQVTASEIQPGVGPGSSGWTAIAKNTGSGPQTLTAGVVCYNGTTA
ncbi:hypothetical protein ACFYZB_24340 [Streptomyces sp. NPDC001852]|uniref:hypothetical protein n=1 Tax=Streptomyces sp. NPDC001852 TaxID=3364619 RepID=UPI003673A94B